MCYNKVVHLEQISLGRLTMPISTLIPGLAVITVWLAACCVVIGLWEKKRKVFRFTITAILFIVFVGLFAGSRIGTFVAEEAVRKQVAANKNILDLVNADISSITKNISPIMQKVVFFSTLACGIGMALHFIVCVIQAIRSGPSKKSKPVS
jgi:prolipoprotein diacylglyceryltransferase